MVWRNSPSESHFSSSVLNKYLNAELELKLAFALVQMQTVFLVDLIEIFCTASKCRRHLWASLMNSRGLKPFTSLGAAPSLEVMSFSEHLCLWKVLAISWKHSFFVWKVVVIRWLCLSVQPGWPNSGGRFCEPASRSTKRSLRNPEWVWTRPGQPNH